MSGAPTNLNEAGTSFVPQLKDSAVPRPPSITANEKGFFGVWRFIVYHDGTEKLYDRDKGPMEFENLSGKAEFLDIKKALKAPILKNPARKANNRRRER